MKSHLSPEQLSAALSAAQAIRDKESRSRALATLAPNLMPKQLGEALSIAKAVGDEYSFSLVVAALTPHLDSEQKANVLDQALAAVKVIGDDENRLRALSALAPLLGPKQLGEALEIAKAIAYGEVRSRALTVLAPYLGPERGDYGSQGDLRREVPVSDYGRTDCLAPHHPKRNCALRSELIAAAGNVSRPAALLAASSGSRLIFQLGGQRGLHDLHRAISDVVRWYP